MCGSVGFGAVSVKYGFERVIHTARNVQTSSYAVFFYNNSFNRWTFPETGENFQLSVHQSVSKMACESLLSSSPPCLPLPTDPELLRTVARRLGSMMDHYERRASPDFAKLLLGTTLCFIRPSASLLSRVFLCLLSSSSP